MREKEAGGEIDFFFFLSFPFSALFFPLKLSSSSGGAVAASALPGLVWSDDGTARTHALESNLGKVGDRPGTVQKQSKGQGDKDHPASARALKGTALTGPFSFWGRGACGFPKVKWEEGVKSGRDAAEWAEGIVSVP